MKGSLYIIVGAKGQGKSTFTKKMIENCPCYIFDVNNEYDMSEDLNDRCTRSTSLDMKEFVDNCLTKVITNRRVVIEDATGFCRGNLGKEFIRMLQGSRHSGNDYIMLFHSIRSIPVQLFDFVNYCVIFKTNDQEAEVNKKYPALVNGFKKIRTAPKYSKTILVINQI